MFYNIDGDIMEKFKYFIYDVLSIEKDKNIIVKEFEYDRSTLVYDFYNKLFNDYIVSNKERLGKYDFIGNNVYFRIVDVISDVLLDSSNGDLFMYEVLLNHDLDKTFCVLPVLPIGDVVARHKNFKIAIYSNDHQQFPHVHVYDQVGQNFVVSLVDLKIHHDVHFNRKDKKKIMDYIKENREILKNHYEEMLSGKLVEKFVVDIIP